MPYAINVASSKEVYAFDTEVQSVKSTYLSNLIVLNGIFQSLPNPFPIPNFRASTEANLTNEILTESDRKYIVQTLAVMLMSYVQKPSLGDCEIVSEALHMKYTFLQGSEVCCYLSMLYVVFY